MPKNSLTEIVRAAVDAVLKAAEFDSKILDDKLQYSAWILGIATAGFAIAVTQSDKILAGATLGPSAGTRIVNGAAALFGISALVGALLKKQVNDGLEAIRKSTTLILKQQMLIDAGAVAVPSADEADPRQLLRNLLDAKYLSAANVADYAEHETAQQTAEGAVARLLVVQQSFVACGYLGLFIARVS